MAGITKKVRKGGSRRLRLARSIPAIPANAPLISQAKEFVAGDRDADGGTDPAVAGERAHPEPDARAAEQQPDTCRHRHRNPQGEQARGRDTHAEQHDKAMVGGKWQAARNTDAVVPSHAAQNEEREPERCDGAHDTITMRHAGSNDAAIRIGERRGNADPDQPAERRRHAGVGAQVPGQERSEAAEGAECEIERSRCAIRESQTNACQRVDPTQPDAGRHEGKEIHGVRSTLFVIAGLSRLPRLGRSRVQLSGMRGTSPRMTN